MVVALDNPGRCKEGEPVGLGALGAGATLLLRRLMIGSLVISCKFHVHNL